MEINCINNTNFQGKLIIANRLSNKPNNCINKVRFDIENLIRKKDYNLYITQDYAKNEICFSTDFPLSQRTPQHAENLNLNAKASKYIDTAKNVIEQHEERIKKQQEIQWEKEQNKAEKKELLELITFSFTFPFLMIAEKIKNIRTTINKLATKFATKKG